MQKIAVGCLAIIGGLAVLSVIGALIAGSRASSSTVASGQAVVVEDSTEAGAAEASAGQPSAESTPTEQPAPATESYAIGQDVTVDQVRWKVLSGSGQHTVE